MLIRRDGAAPLQVAVEIVLVELVLVELRVLVELEKATAAVESTRPRAWTSSTKLARAAKQ